MKLTDTYLKSVSDDLALIDQGEFAVALVGLAEAHNTYSAQREGGIELRETSTGRELKEAIGKLRMRDQIRVLDIYSSALREMATTRPAPLEFLDTMPLPPAPPGRVPVAPPGFMETVSGAPPVPIPPLVAVPPPPVAPVACTLAEQEAAEDRKLRRWLVKTGFWFVMVFVSMVVGSILTIAVRSGQMPDGVVTNSVLSTATEILKLIFSSSFSQ
jgi:hypothetical protein